MVKDLNYMDAVDVYSVRLRLHPIDVGFDLRLHDMLIDIDDCVENGILRASYPAQDGSRRVMEGPKDEVMDRLKQLGYKFKESAQIP